MMHEFLTEFFCLLETS